MYNSKYQQAGFRHNISLNYLSTEKNTTVLGLIAPVMYWNNSLLPILVVGAY